MIKVPPKFHYNSLRGYKMGTPFQSQWQSPCYANGNPTFIQINNQNSRCTCTSHIEHSCQVLSKSIKRFRRSLGYKSVTDKWKDGRTDILNTICPLALKREYNNKHYGPC